jgi:hypothetical protein
MEAPGFSEETILKAHGRTFHGFTLGLKIACLHLAVIITFLVIAFATQAGVLWGIIAALFVAWAGVYALRHGLAHSTENDSLHLPEGS